MQNNFARTSRFFVHFLPSLHDYYVKMPNFTFYGKKYKEAACSLETYLCIRMLLVCIRMCLYHPANSLLQSSRNDRSDSASGVCLYVSRMPIYRARTRQFFAFPPFSRPASPMTIKRRVFVAIMEGKLELRVS